jgi:tol-pal system protein YbgF
MKQAILTLAVCLTLGCVTKTEFQPYQTVVRDLQVETDQLQRGLEETRSEVIRSLGSVRTDQADIKADMSDIRTEIQALRGELSYGMHEREVAGKERQSMEESVALQLSYLQQQMETTEARLARIEEYFGLKPLPRVQTPKAPAKPASTPQKTAGGGEENTAAMAVPEAPPTKELSAEEAYEMAYHLFKSNENEAARKAFDQFVRRYPQSALVDNALFWMGETYYRGEDYENAVLKYQQVVKEYPKGSKGPDALLKMGYALEKMNEPEAAVGAMEKLLKTYPKAPQAKLASRKIEQLKSSPAGTKKDKGN